MLTMYRVVSLALLAITFGVHTAHAQTTFGVHEKAIERVNEARSVGPLSVDDVFGDQISNFDGGGEFTNVDISVPGNNGLPVELRRSLKIDDRMRLNGTHLGGFAEWDLDIPHLSGIFATAAGGWRPASGTVNQRCSLPSEPAFAGTMPPEDYWSGYNLHVPGAGSQPLLVSPSAMLPAAAGGPYPWITKGMWRISCKSATKNGYAGQAFVALSPAGVKYHLDWAISKSHAGVKNNGTGYNAVRQVIYFLASRVEDRFGNWVDYTYSGDKLTGITSSDGRSISLTYMGNKITSAASSVGSWSYAYTGEKLSQVTRPDGSKWTYSSSGALAIYPPSWSPAFEDPTGCPDTLEPSSGGYILTIGAPSGATGTFTFGVLQHFRSAVPDTCVIESPTYWYRKIPFYNWNLSLLTKVVSGPGLPSMTWTYDYGQPDYLMGGSTKENSVTGPSSTYVRYTYGTDYAANEGQLLKVERGSGPSAILQSKTHAYVTNAEAGSQYFPSYVGYNPLMYSDPVASGGLRPLKQTVTTQQGVNFNWQVNACTGKYCFDVFGNPSNVTKASTLPGSPSKAVATEYEHNTTYWVLGQVKKTTEGSYAASETTFNALALPWVMSSFGRVVQTLTYNADGTVATVKDGNNNTITLSNWYRGIPQLITYPDSTTQSATVSGAGWVTSVTDQNGYVTGYGYDTMGRLASVVYPTGDTTAWNMTTLSFTPSSTPVYGLPAGHWRQVIQTGNNRKVVMMDALWRPVVTETYDAGDLNGTISQVVNRYDENGRVSFTSYPQRNLDPTVYNTWANPSLAPNAAGTHAFYDALGRVTSASHDSELGLLTTLTEYLSDFQIRVTNPRGFSTVTQYQAFDVPTTDYPNGITQSAGADTSATEIHRDIFGKPQRIRKRNASGSLFVDRNYVYHANQLLCKVIEPETGATVLGYDDAGNLTHSASGVTGYGDLNQCNHAEAWASGRTVVRTFNNMNRLTSLAFPDGLGNQSWAYTPDGLPATITTYNSLPSNQDGLQVINAYSYNRRRLMIGESLAQKDWYTWGVGYGYDSNASLASQSYYDGSTVSYHPNALGQPTRVQDHTGFIFASGAEYYPNGAVKQFTYGNGIVHSMLQNVRQLPARSVDSGVLDLDTRFDANGNVSDIYDVQRGAFYNRHMQYDGLDRLTAAGSWVFGGDAWHRYTYDAIDNMTSWKLPGVKDYAQYVYNPKNQLGNIKDSAGATIVALEYDDQGNLNYKNNQNYDFDIGNRLREVTGKEYYRYDGHGRRVMAWRPNLGSVFSQYTSDGKVFFQWDEPQNKRLYNLYLGNNLVAIREVPLAGGALVTKYQHTDALGSPVAVTNEAGTVIERNDYEPYGAVIGKPNYQGIGYTGHVQDAATGLTYMQQRYYDPQVGLFLSADPVTAYSKPVGQFHRYRYANNSPYNFIDPDGREIKLTGSKEDQQTFIRQASEFTGMKITQDSDGTLRSSQCDVNGAGVPEAAQSFVSAMNSDTSIKIEAVSGDLNVYIDSYATGKTDVADVAGIASKSREMGAGTLVHTLTEYRVANEAGGQTRANFGAAHDAALRAESKIFGASMRGNSLSGPGQGLAPGRTISYDYMDSSGRVVKSFTYTLDSNGTPR